jgi:hypothetical protein
MATRTIRRLRQYGRTYGTAESGREANDRHGFGGLVAPAVQHPATESRVCPNTKVATNAWNTETAEAHPFPQIPPFARFAADDKIQ